jgi:hypothetical protein
MAGYSLELDPGFTAVEAFMATSIIVMILVAVTRVLCRHAEIRHSIISRPMKAGTGRAT